MPPNTQEPYPARLVSGGFHNPVSFIIVVLFIAALFINILDLPADSLFDYPDFALSSGSIGTALTVSAGGYAFLLLIGFYPWVVRLAGLITVGLLVLQIMDLTEALRSIADSLGIGVDEVRSIADFFDGDLAEEFVNMQEAYFVAGASILLILSLFMPRSKNRKI